MDARVPQNWYVPPYTFYSFFIPWTNHQWHIPWDLYPSNSISFPSISLSLLIYISTCLLMYIIQVLERVIHSLSLVYHKRGEDTWTSQDKMVYTLYLLSTYTFLGSSHLSSYLLPLFLIFIIQTMALQRTVSVSPHLTGINTSWERTSANGI